MLYFHLDLEVCLGNRCHLETRLEQRKPKRGASQEQGGKRRGNWDFSGGPMVKNLPCDAGGMDSIPALGTKIPRCRATTCSLRY